MKSFQWLLSSYILISIISFSPLSHADNTASVSELPLKPNQGYLLLSLDVDGVAPSVEISKPSTSRKDFQVVTTIELKDKKDDMIILPLDKGIYQITRVNAPYYDLPYWLDTAKEEEWKFRIEPGKVNYLGKLVIGKKRGTDFVMVVLLNNVAKDWEKIQSEKKTILKKNPLSMAQIIRDDYLMELLK